MGNVSQVYTRLFYLFISLVGQKRATQNKNPHTLRAICNLVPPARIELATDPYHGSVMPFN